MLKFRCNICSAEAPIASLFDIDREWQSCFGCGSSARTRWIAHALSSALFNQSLPLCDFPSSQVRGIGLSDSPSLGGRLAERLDYTNTFFDREPRLDISQPIPLELRHQYDFVIASEVFEHVAPPIQNAFDNLALLLKPGGVVIFTVPWTREPTVEHFPELYDWRLEQENGRSVLLNETVSGEQQRFDDLRFHGGTGSTVEMRVFGKNNLEQHFDAAGFRLIEFAPAHTYLGYGVIFHDEISLPCAVRLSSKSFADETSPKEIAGEGDLLADLRRDRTSVLQDRHSVRLLSGWYEPSQSLWRWTSTNFSFVLCHSPRRKGRLVMRFFNPMPASGQVLTVSAEGTVLGQMHVTAGRQVFTAELPSHIRRSPMLVFCCTISPAQPPAPSDDRSLGVIVHFARTHRLGRNVPFYIESPFWS